ncbi:MAG: RDD family protein [Bacteroidetes bacterium]|nr:RDD family protein [Bacteroidota bacterium]
MKDTLDTFIVNQNRPDPLSNLASASQRFLNFFVDTIIYYCITLTILLSLLYFDIISEEVGDYLVYLLLLVVRFCYYFLSELSNGKTFGKLITKTTAVNDDGLQMTSRKVFKRTLCRLIPFDFISFFWGNGWHDSISGTLVAKDIR